MTIDSVEVTGWPKEPEIEKARTQPDRVSTITVVFRYSNHDNEDWSCTYSVVILDDEGHELGSATRTASLEEGEVDDTNRLNVKLRTLDVARATKLLVRTAPKRD